MKYLVELELNLARDRVIELFNNTENLKKWQPDLLTFDHQEGEPGQVGAKSLLRYKMGSREIEMIETITEMNIPVRFSATYEAKGVWNSVENEFIEQSELVTLWKLASEFKCTGWMKIMSIFMSGEFKKQTNKYMKQFKDFAEGEHSQAEAHYA